MAVFNLSGSQYFVYLTDNSVELRQGGDSKFSSGRLICAQKNYKNIHDFAINLARHKKIQFINFIPITPQAALANMSLEPGGY